VSRIQAEARRLFQTYDINGYAVRTEYRMPVQQLAAVAFGCIDQPSYAIVCSDGHMDREEFSVFYRDTLRAIGMPAPTESDIDSAITVLDKDKNNEISLEEFETWWQLMAPARPQRRYVCQPNTQTT
jgi:hypothetical protein